MKEELQAKINRLITDATAKENVGNRSDLFDRYMAEPYGDEVKGRSKFVSSEVADAVEAILPDVMDVFTSAEDILEFSPVGPEDEDAAKQETLAVSHIFWQQNPGFENLYVWIKEALIQQNAYCWRGWVEKERVSIEEYEDLTLEELTAIVDQLDGEYEFLEQSGFDIEELDGVDFAVPEIGEDGQPAPISVKLRCVKKEKKYVIEPFPQEDYFGTPRWGKLSLDGIPCCGRRHRDKSMEDLKAMGFSEASLEKLTSSVTDDEGTDARHHTRDLDESQANNENIEVFEAYMMLDFRGDGKNVLTQVWCSADGTTVLEWEDGGEAIEEVSQIPISALTPYLIPHRHIGRSVSEQVDDIQLVNTVLLRQVLDNTYATNYGRPYFDENSAGEFTYTDLENVDHGAPVRTGGADIQWYTPPNIVGGILPLLDKFDALKEQRVGATRYNQGLDAESLNKTASGISQIMNASQKKTKLIARTLAETGIRDLFLGIHRDLRAGPMKELAMKLRGKWTQVDPRTWRYRTDMVVNIGMGRGDRDETRAGLGALGNVQRELMASGSRMVDEKKLYNTIVKTLATFGIHNPEPYITDPETLPPPPEPGPPPPDPLLISAQSQAQKVQADAAIAAQKMQLQEAQSIRDHEYRMAKLRLDDTKAAAEIDEKGDRLDLDKNKAVMEDDFKRDKLEIDALTGWQRDVVAKVTSEPPFAYKEVTDES